MKSRKTPVACWHNSKSFLFNSCYYRYILFFTIFTLYILIICTNSTILYLIFTHKNHHEPMYIFIAALLLNSVLYSTTMYPKLLIDFLSEKQVTTYSTCGSELPLLTAMAYDRYVAICKPLEYQTIMTKTTVSIFLVLAWLVPACHIAVQAIASAEAKLWDSNIKGIFCNNAVYTLQCQRSRLITVFGRIPCQISATNSIFITENNRIFMRKLFSVILRSYFGAPAAGRLPLFYDVFCNSVVLISASVFFVYDISIARVELDFPITARIIMTLQIVLYHPFFNPFVYRLKMKEISKHLKKLLCQAKIILELSVERNIK
uniref:G-protein coupled receptors family 1 profile domain-containing protein n=1 Tax=Haplochromis burtoni TaxID=8153 RepID=A0A3Q2WPC1_HAPBU